MKALKRVLLTSLGMILIGQTWAETVDSLPAVAALLQTSISNGDQQEQTQLWYLWREHNRFEIRNREAQVGELWEKLKDDQVAYTWLNHQDRLAIRYRPSDLKILQRYPDWSAKNSIINPALLNQLIKTNSMDSDIGKLEYYRGEIGGLQLAIEWLPDYVLPARIVQSKDRYKLEIKLLEIYSFDQAPWSMSTADHYQDLDYSDLGDNEAHPLTQKHIHGLADEQSIQYPHHH